MDIDRAEISDLILMAIAMAAVVCCVVL